MLGVLRDALHHCNAAACREALRDGERFGEAALHRAACEQLRFLLRFQLGLSLAARCLAVLLPLVAVSGCECVDVLTLAGFEVRSRKDDETVLTKGLRSVTVPTVAMLSPDEMSTILRDAGLAYSDFLERLSETPTAPDLRIAVG